MADEPESAAPHVAPGPVAGRGQIVEDIGGGPRLLSLSIGELEQIEGATGMGVYELHDALFGARAKPTMDQVKAVVAHALLGGGAPAWEANKLMNEVAAGDLPRLFMVAKGALGVALHPDLFDEDDDDDAQDAKKKADAGSTTEPEKKSAAQD